MKRRALPFCRQVGKRRFSKRLSSTNLTAISRLGSSARASWKLRNAQGTGDALCIAEFHDAEGKRKLYVFTTSGSQDEIQYIGHNPQVVSFCIDRKTVNCEKPMDANEVAALFGKNVTASKQSASWRGCTREQAAQIIQTQRTLQASNDPCVVHWRSIEVRQHPERAIDLECAGLKAYEDPQPTGHPIPLAECDRITRESQQHFGLPATGLSEDQKTTYRATWGH